LERKDDFWKENNYFWKEIRRLWKEINCFWKEKTCFCYELSYFRIKEGFVLRERTNPSNIFPHFAPI